jgi:uncharacterized protein YdeI (YjbR/CyaY-like superfamily)
MEWRRWLAQHHREKREIWLVLFKKTSSRRSITYDDAVEEAICYGWIDGQTRRVDADRYALRLTPRRKKGSWSRSNKARALKMLRARKMTRSGKAVLPTAFLTYGSS